MAVSAEEYLWRSVITQAMDDLFTSDYKLQREVVCWFFKNNDDFSTVCEFAKMSPQYVRKKSTWANHKLQREVTKCIIS